MALSYEFTEEQNDLREMVREFANAEILPLVEEAERTEKFPVDLLPKLGELGPAGDRVPRGVRRDRRRQDHRVHLRRGDGQGLRRHHGVGQRACRPRRVPDLQVRHRRPARGLPAALDRRRDHRRLRHHRAEHRLRRRRPGDARRQEERRLRHQRPQELHHQRHDLRLLPGRGLHRQEPARRRHQRVHRRPRPPPASR